MLLDLSKAFDGIEHGLLLNFVHWVFLEMPCNCLGYFLTDRSQSVRIGSDLSDSRKVAHCVPDGSILGPALFNI